ncbi:hypothetical protein [Paludisphaera rhizosphaerae]|uniref:hypothetical protein n=1 Tax=Paludisphaera rhizosphaerae TaxID=2711216 RepID=UPI0013EC7928|nr:hypothetical protein [Paludisphaera rhizosphaerae]
MEPVRGNPNAIRLRGLHAPYRMTAENLAWIMAQGWHEQRGLRWLELVNGRVMAFKHDRFVEAVTGAFAELLGARLGTAWSVTAAPLHLHLDEFNVFGPRVVVHPPGVGGMLTPKDVALVVDFVTGVNEDRVFWGRRKYLKAGLRQHWLVNLRGGFSEIAMPGVDVYYRRDAEQEVPIVVGDLPYGSFKLSDLLTIG